MKKFKSTEELKQALAHHVQSRKTENGTVLIVSAGTCGQARGSLNVIDALEKVIQDKT